MVPPRRSQIRDYRQAMAEAVDRAITKVAMEELYRMGESTFLPEELPHLRVHPALQSLDGLRQGNPPDYDDPMVALLYLTWYQPKQINLAYTIIKKLLEIKGSDRLVLSDSGRLHVVDFGCGSLAMQFAVALVVSHVCNRRDRGGGVWSWRPGC